MQLTLSLLEDPPRPEAAVWEQLSEEDREAVVAQLAAMILGAALGASGEESDDA